MLQQTTEAGKGNGRDKYSRKHVERHSFADRLAATIKNPPENSITLNITPSMALDMLKYNDRNRPISGPTVARNVREMTEGRFHWTRLPIIFSDAGRLIDGQHRLIACVKSGVTIKSDVVFGAPDEAFAYIDVGKKRSSGDIFAIEKVENANLMAAATLKLISILELWPRSLGKSPNLTVSEVYERYAAFPRLSESAHFGHAFNKARIMEGSLATALHYYCAQKNRAMANEFFEKVATGVGITGKNDPAARLRDRLIANLASEDKMSARRKAGLVIKAWNAFRDGRPCKVLKYTDDEAWPRAR